MNIFHENPVSSTNPKSVMRIGKNCCTEFLCKIFFWRATYHARYGVDFKNIKPFCHRINCPYIVANQSRIRLPANFLIQIETSWNALYIPLVEIKKTKGIFFVVENKNSR